MLVMEAVGPRGEELAMAAGKARDIAVGWDSEFNSATFDTDEIDDSELEAVIVEELDDRDPDWRSQLRLVD
jgi:predicted methyltransferase MtxX (methanogen marker protein 4)